MRQYADAVSRSTRACVRPGASVCIVSRPPSALRCVALTTTPASHPPPPPPPPPRPLPNTLVGRLPNNTPAAPPQARAPSLASVPFAAAGLAMARGREGFPSGAGGGGGARLPGPDVRPATNGGSPVRRAEGRRTPRAGSKVQGRVPARAQNQGRGFVCNEASAPDPAHTVKWPPPPRPPQRASPPQPPSRTAS